MGRERGNYNLCGCASSMKLRWYIIIQPPGLCGVCYKGTTSTVVVRSLCIGFQVVLAYLHKSQIKGGKSSIICKPVMELARMRERIVSVDTCPNLWWSVRISMGSSVIGVLTAANTCSTLNNPFTLAGM